MKEFKYTITDPEGIHARPAGELVKVCKEFDGEDEDAAYTKVSAFLEENM